MINENFKAKDLPIKEMEVLGLAQNGKLNITSADLNALLSGNRTDLHHLTNLSSGGAEIDKLDAKLSLRPDGNGKLNLLLHPIYKSAQAPEFLTKTEVEDLKSGKVNSVFKEVGDAVKKPLFVEFDKETNEFIKVDSSKIIAPESVNNHTLSQVQKNRYKQGQTVELADGTAIQATGKNNKGILSNRSLLVLSLVVDGGISFLIIKGIQALMDRKKQDDYSKGYNDAINNILKQQKQRNIAPVMSKNSIIVLKDFKEVKLPIATIDQSEAVKTKINVNDIKLGPQHLETLREIQNYDNLHQLVTEVNPQVNRKIADELKQGKTEQPENNLARNDQGGNEESNSIKEKTPLEIEHNKAQGDQLEHFASLGEVVAMIEEKRDHVIDYIQETGKGVDDVDYLKDVVSGMGHAINSQVRNTASQYVVENNAVIENRLEEKSEQGLESTPQITEDYGNHARIGR